jgi:uncharacterized NAD(P)/FAD-binding protein YdhS
MIQPVARNVVIVGGGFTGACAAIQLVRASKVRLLITIIESNERLGRGLAYSAVDPDHRLNAPSFVHSIIPDDAWHFTRWCLANDIVGRDPQALRADGSAYIRRSDFARYIEDTVRQHADWPATGSRIVHVRDQAVSASVSGANLQVQTARGRSVQADMILLATGNPTPRLQPPFAASLAAHPSIIENPLDTDRLYAMPPDAHVLLIGSGLTALDVLSTLVRRDHRGDIVVISRRGLKPKPQGTMPAAFAGVFTSDIVDKLPPRVMLDRILAPAPEFMTQAAVTPTVRGYLQALRARIKEVELQGGNWYQPFDDLREAVWQVWPKLPTKEKRRFLRKMRTWYDVHRFRSPPQNEEMVRAAEAQGRIRFLAARVQSVAPVASSPSIVIALKPFGRVHAQTEVFDVVINCTGLDAVAGLSSNPFLVTLVNQGWIRRDACSMGFDVDANCKAIGADGSARASLRIVGPPTVGTFGDPIGAMFIAAQINRVLPDVLNGLESA